MRSTAVLRDATVSDDAGRDMARHGVVSEGQGAGYLLLIIERAVPSAACLKAKRARQT